MRFFTIAIFVALVGCASPGRQDPPGTHTAQQLYEVKCAKCHKFYNPADYSQQDWDMWMRKMSKKAKLNPDQKDLLSHYLATFRGGNPTQQPDLR